MKMFFQSQFLFVALFFESYNSCKRFNFPIFIHFTPPPLWDSIWYFLISYPQPELDWVFLFQLPIPLNSIRGKTW